MTERDKLKLHIQTLMRMPLQYGSADTVFTIDEVHFGLLKVIPDLKREEVQEALSQLEKKGYVSQAFAMKDQVYGPVYMIREASDVDHSVPPTDDDLDEEPDPSEERDRAMRDDILGAYKEIGDLRSVLFHFMRWSIRERGYTDASADELAQDCIYDHVNVEKYLSLKPSGAAGKGGRQTMLDGLQALIQSRIASLNEGQPPPPDPNSVTERVIWYVERDSRVSELERLLVIIENMRKQGGEDDD